MESLITVSGFAPEGQLAFAAGCVLGEKYIFGGVVLMTYLANDMFEGINIGVGIVTLRIKHPMKAFASIAKRPSTVTNEFKKPP